MAASQACVLEVCKSSNITRKSVLEMQQKSHSNENHMLIFRIITIIRICSTEK